jgi:hypothetical protein
MARHIASIAGSDIPKVTVAEFWSQLRCGDKVFCEGMSGVIDSGIKFETGSCLTHVMQVWLDGAVWTTLESTIDRGVHCDTFADYVNNYDGNLVIARRPALTDAMLRAERDAMLRLLDSHYDWKQEAEIAAHNLLPFFKVGATRKEYYCSGLQYVGSLATAYPLQAAKLAGEMPTPEDNWTDASVVAVCALVK